VEVPQGGLWDREDQQFQCLLWVLPFLLFLWVLEGLQVLAIQVDLAHPSYQWDQ